MKRSKSTEEGIFFVWVKILKQCEAFYRELMKKIVKTSIAQSLDIFVVRFKGESVSFTRFTKFNALWWVEYLTKKKRKSQIYLRGISAKQHEQQNAKAKTKNKNN